MTLGFFRTSYLMKLQISSEVAFLKEVTVILRENYDSFTCTVLLQQLLLGLLNKYRFFEIAVPKKSRKIFRKTSMVEFCFDKVIWQCY